jgi:MFS-type transporter involved in bile tolerance (Atg22 family)
VADLKARTGWAFYDWANSSYAAIISTFVFPAYFTQQVAGDTTHATNLWGNTIGIVGLLVALTAPMLGAVADQMGRRKPWIAVFTAICVLATLSLWWVRPEVTMVVPALLLVESHAAFWTFGMLLGVFVGPVQAAGRSYLARAAPEALRIQMFGLLAFSGKAAAFVGPFLVGWVTATFDSQRAGMSVIVVLLSLGFLLMLRVPESDAARAA